MKGKIKPKGVVSHANGPTSTINDPAKFKNGGGSKTMSGKTVVSEAAGPTITYNKTHIPTMNADKPAPMSKSMGDKKWFDPHTASMPLNASEGHTSPPKSPLKTSYPK
jgi:hypothetical protein